MTTDEEYVESSVQGGYPAQVDESMLVYGNEEGEESKVGDVKKCARCGAEYTVGVTGEWCAHYNLAEAAEGTQEFRPWFSPADRRRIKEMMTEEQRQRYNTVKRGLRSKRMWRKMHLDIVMNSLRAIENRGARAQAASEFVKQVRGTQGFVQERFIEEVMRAEEHDGKQQ